MKKAEVKIGVTYYAKVSGKIQPVRIVSRNDLYNYWRAVNTLTGREIKIKSAQRLRSIVS